MFLMFHCAEVVVLLTNILSLITFKFPLVFKISLMFVEIYEYIS